MYNKKYYFLKFIYREQESFASLTLPSPLSFTLDEFGSDSLLDMMFFTLDELGHPN